MGFLGMSTQDIYVSPLNLSGVAIHDCISNNSNMLLILSAHLRYRGTRSAKNHGKNAGVQVMLLLA